MTGSSEARRDCLVVALLWAIPLVLLRPFQNTPFNDDWVYGWSVEHFLLTHDLKILDNATSLNPVQVLWGALFCLPAGFSFTALRVSTWTLSTVGLCGLYLVVREMGAPRHHALLAAGTLAAYPVYMVLSYSFMTDVPFVAVLIWSTYAMLRARRTGRMFWLAAASVFSALAVGFRPVGAILGLILPTVVRWQSLGWPKRGAAAWWIVVPWLAVAAVSAWYSTAVEHRADLTWIEGSPAWRVGQLKYAFLGFPKYLVDTWWFCTGALGIALAALAIGRLTRTVLRRACVVLGMSLVMLIAVGVLGGHVYVPLHSGEVWSLVELSGTEHNYPEAPLPLLPTWAGFVLVPASAVLFALAAGAVEFRRLQTAEGVHVLLASGLFLLMAAVWLVGDNRYILPLLPSAIALVASARAALKWKVSTAALLLIALVGAVGVRDHLHYNRALWDAVAYLQSAGVPAREIDGGWAINGWLQYAHPENAAHDASGDVRVNWVNDRSVPSRFHLSKGPRTGWTVVKTFPYTRWAARSGAIHVLTQ